MMLRNTSATGNNPVVSATCTNYHETGRRSQCVLSNGGLPISFHHNANMMVGDNNIQQPESPDWYEGDISYIISQREKIDNTINPALRHKEQDSSQDISSSGLSDSQAST